MKVHIKNKHTDIYVMTCSRDFALTCFSLIAIIAYFSEYTNIYINHDESLGRFRLWLLKLLFPSVILITSVEMGIKSRQLTKYPLLLKFYLNTWQGKKVLNPLLFSGKNSILLFDSDLVFLQEPIDIISIIKRTKPFAFFNEDFSYFQCISKDEIQRYFNITPLDYNLNASIVGLSNTCKPSLEVINDYLTVMSQIETDRAMNNYYYDQTFYYYYFSKRRFELSLSKKHYASMMDDNILLNSSTLEDYQCLHFPSDSKKYYFEYVKRYYLTKRKS